MQLLVPILLLALSVVLIARDVAITVKDGCKVYVFVCELVASIGVGFGMIGLFNQIG